MGKSPTWVAWGVAAGVTIGSLAALPGFGEPPPKLTSGGPDQPVTVAQPPAPTDAKHPSATLFKDVKVFDGKSGRLTTSTSVLVVGNTIKQISCDIAAPEKATVIDAGGRTLMPGLID